jgi:hypothetical protein
VIDGMPLRDDMIARIEVCCPDVLEDNGQVFPVLKLEKADGTWAFANVDCIVSGLAEKGLGEQLTTLTASFGESVTQLMRGPDADAIKSKFLRAWMQAIAEETVRIGGKI